jgi:hypothetical protein
MGKRGTINIIVIIIIYFLIFLMTIFNQYGRVRRKNNVVDF